MSCERLEWEELAEHLNKHFHQPDLEALALLLSCYIAHFLFPNSRPVWPMLIAVPGSGKSEITCAAFKQLAGAFVMGDITPNTFISGLPKNRGGSSLLELLLPLDGHSAKAMRTHGVILFKDFTSILSKRPDARSEIIAVMREVWDGTYTPKKGVKVSSWEGKVTIAGLVTPAFERHWAVQRDLGERFVQVRSTRGDGLQIGRAAAAQRDQTRIAKRTAELALELCSPPYPALPLATTDQVETVVHHAEYAAWLRTAVERDNNQSREIIGIPQPEAPTRLTQAMLQIAGGHAVLMGRKAIAAPDIALAQRVGWDSIPINRARVMTYLTEKPGMAEWSPAVKHATGLPASTLDWIADELAALGALDITINNDGDKMLEVTSKFQKLYAGATRVADPTGVVVPFSA